MLRHIIVLSVTKTVPSYFRPIFHCSVDFLTLEDETFSPRSFETPSFGNDYFYRHVKIGNRQRSDQPVPRHSQLRLFARIDPLDSPIYEAWLQPICPNA